MPLTADSAVRQNSDGVPAATSSTPVAVSLSGGETTAAGNTQSNGGTGNSPFDGYFVYGDTMSDGLIETPGFLTAVTSTNNRG